jgi:hypothetical protein
MAQPSMFLLNVAAAALTLGINGQTVTPVDDEKPLSTSDIVIAADDIRAEWKPEQQGNSIETYENAKGSVKMGEEEDNQTADNQAATPEK